MSQPINTPEVWRSIPGYEGCYEVSNHGRVRSLDRKITHRNGVTSTRKGRVLAPGTMKRGHQYVLVTGGKKQYVHRLVALAFIGPIPSGGVVRHLNDDPKDNRPENLAIGTQTDNMYDAVRNGIHPMAQKTHCIRGHEYTPDNTYIQPGNGGRVCRTCSTENRREWKRANIYKGGLPPGERTHCPQGHEYSGDNILRVPSRPNARYCRTCNRAQKRKRQERLKEQRRMRRQAEGTDRGGA